MNSELKVLSSNTFLSICIMISSFLPLSEIQKQQWVDVLKSLEPKNLKSLDFHLKMQFLMAPKFKGEQKQKLESCVHVAVINGMLIKKIDHHQKLPV